MPPVDTPTLSPTHGPARALIAVAAGILATLITWLALGSYNDRPSTTPTASAATGTMAISPADLPRLARSLQQPIYWAPNAPYATLALIRLSGGVQLRYLPRGVALNTQNPAYLVIGSYPLPGAFAAVSNLAAEHGAKVDRLSGGGVAVVRPSAPHSVYLAYPGSAVEIEVYNPSIGAALRIVRGGQLRAVTG